MSDPLTIFDIAPISDGAAFVLLTRESIAKDLGVDYTVIKGIGLATQTLSIMDREDIKKQNIVKFKKK